MTTDDIIFNKLPKLSKAEEEDLDAYLKQCRESGNIADAIEVFMSAETLRKHIRQIAGTEDLPPFVRLNELYEYIVLKTKHRAFYYNLEKISPQSIAHFAILIEFMKMDWKLDWLFNVSEKDIDPAEFEARASAAGVYFQNTKKVKRMTTKEAIADFAAWRKDYFVSPAVGGYELE